MDVRYLRRGKKKKINIKRLLLLVLFFCIIALMPTAYSSFFEIKLIQVKGNQNISTEKILSLISDYYGKNLLSVNSEEIKQIITSSVPIEQAKVDYKLPHTLIISVKERDIAAAIRYLSGFVIIDSKGHVVRLEPKLESYDLPVVTGLTIIEANVAKKIIVKEGRDSFDSFLNLINSLKDLSSELSEIHVDTKSNEVVVFNLYTLDGYQIVLEHLDDNKIVTIKEVLNDLRANDRGKGLIILIHETPVFRPY
ncbi:MAG: cell division protein FtsQ/DivIB [Tepidanaerobacteraceae bacterium]|jgi:cell division protein FtsQ